MAKDVADDLIGAVGRIDAAVAAALVARPDHRPDDEAHVNAEWETPVVEFPLHGLEVGQMLIHAAVQITVCAVGQGSKLWYRMQLAEFDGQPATCVPEQVVHEYFELCDECGMAVTSKIAPIYEQILRRRSGGGSCFRVGRTFDLISRSVSTEDEALRQVLRGMADGVSAEVAVKDMRVSGRLAPFFRLSGYRANPFGASGLSKAADYVGWQRVAGNGFDSLVHSAMERSRTTLTGLSTPGDAESARLASRATLVDLSPLY